MAMTIYEELQSNTELISLLRAGKKVNATEWQRRYYPGYTSRSIQKAIARIATELDIKPNVPDTGSGESSALAELSFVLPDSPAKVETNWLRLRGDFCVLSDLHIPCYHKDTLSHALRTAHQRKITQCLIAGDVFDFNQFHKSRGLEYQRRAQDDLESARPILRALQDVFAKIYVIMGNHDDWFSKHMRNHFDANFLFASIFHEFSKTEWSDFGQADIESAGQTWKILHGANVSSANPLGVAKRHAAIHHCNILMGHQHWAESGYDASGKYQVIVMGGCADTSRMPYLHYQPRTMPKTRNSYVILRDGMADHIVP